MFQEPFLTHTNCHRDICQGNICPGNICPYQEYLSWYSPDFDQTLKVSSWDHLGHMPAVMVTFVQGAFDLATFVHSTNISPVTDPYFWEPRFLWITFFVKTPTKTSLTQVWVLCKNDFAHHPPPQTQCQQYLSC